MRQLRILISLALVLCVAIQATLPFRTAGADVDEQTRYAGTGCQVVGGSYTGYADWAWYGRSAITFNYACTAVRLSGYHECDNGSGSSMPTTWAGEGEDLRHLQYYGVP